MDFIRKNFRDRGIKAALEIQQGEIRLHGLGGEDLDEAVSFLDSESAEVEFWLDEISATVVTMPQWKEAMKKLGHNY